MDCDRYHSNQHLDSSLGNFPFTSFEMSRDACRDCAHHHWEKQELTTIYEGRKCKSQLNHRCDNSECVKQLRIPGRDWYHSVGDCKMMTLADSECSNLFYSDTASCYCYLNSTCCQETSVCGTKADSAFNVYDVSLELIPDPTCTDGLLSTDGTLCCPSTCTDTDGNNVCGVAGDCKDWGMCCGDGLVKSCSTSGAPCNM